MGLSERWHSGTVVVGGRESVFHRLHLLRPVGCSDLQETLHILRDSNHAWVFEGVLKVLSFVPDGSYSRTFVCFFSFVLGFFFFLHGSDTIPTDREASGEAAQTAMHFRESSKTL